MNGQADVQIQANPYVGPRTFEEGDGDRFFGREREARTLLSLVIADPLVLFYAQSGAGKSSLLNARLIPQLRERGFEVLPVGRVGGALPEGLEPVANVFTFNLLASLDRGRAQPAELAQLTLHDYLKQNAAGQEGRAAGAAPHNGDRPYRVLVIDQFEEIVTSHLEHWSDRDGFFQQLNEALRHDDRLWVVLTMREDHAAALAPYTELLTGRMRARFSMQRMEAPAALEAIRLPAAVAGRPFAPGVAEALVDNLRQIRVQDGQNRPGQFVEPVQLQVVCYQLWQHLADRPPGEIRQEDLDELGDVDTALAQFYEQAISRVMKQTGVPELQLRSWFEQHLITEAGTRGTVYQGVEQTAGLDNDIVQLLAGQFLLRAEIRAGGTWYELIHDRFVGPIQQANERWRLTQSPLLMAAAAWERSGRRRQLLYEGELLEEALATVNRETAEPLVQAFLDASEAAQSQEALAEAEMQAAAQARRAEAEVRSAQRMHRISRVSMVLFVAGIIAVAIALFASSQAESRRQAAEEARNSALVQQSTAEAASTRALGQQQAAEAASTLAWSQQATAVSASTFADQQRATAVAARDQVVAQQATAVAASTRALEQEALAEVARNEAVTQEEGAATAVQQVEGRRRLLLAQTLAFHALNVAQQTQDSELVTLLLLEAGRIRSEQPAGVVVDPRESEKLEETMAAAARLIVEQPYFNVTLHGLTAPIRAVAWSAGGQTVVAVAEDGSIAAWSLARPGGPAELIASGDSPADLAAMTPDARLLAVGDNDGSITLWRLDEPGSAPLTLDAEAPLISLALSADGRHLAASTEARDLLRWDLQAEEPVRRRLPDVHPAGFHDLIFAPTEDTLYALAPSEPRSFVYTWFPDGTKTQDRPFLPIAFSRDGELVALANPNPTLFPVRELILVARAGTNNLFLTDEADATLQPPLSFSPDNQLLADTPGNQIRLWSLAAGGAGGTAGIAGTLAGQPAEITALAFTPQMALLSGSADGTVRLWRPSELDSLDALLRQGCDEVARNLSREEWQRYLGEESYRPTCQGLPVHPSVDE